MYGIGVRKSSHRSGRPRRPHGRRIKMTAISANTENSENPGKTRNAEAQHLAIDARAEEGAPERAEAADHHDDEGLDDDLDIHAGDDALDLRHEGSRDAGEKRGELEHPGIEPADI